jgi:hypothetical protein
MGSSGKKKTTMAKLTRESRLRERRAEKAARKQARKEAAANGTAQLGEVPIDEFGEPIGPDTDEPADEPAVQAPVDA